MLGHLAISRDKEDVIFLDILFQDTTGSDEDVFPVFHADGSSSPCHPPQLMELLAEGDHGVPGGDGRVIIGGFRFPHIRTI